MFPITVAAMKIKKLQELKEHFAPSPKMPVLFLGHGSPMNAIEENLFVQGFRNIAKTLPTPSAVLCISAHWETPGTWVTGTLEPRTIHDFGGFPQSLFDVRYPAKGSPELAKEIQNTIHKTQVHLDDQWGLDHGTWSVVKHLYPLAQIPVIQMSLDYKQGPQYHYELGKELSSLRERGILIIGSGNMVHNLSKVDWRRLNDPFAFDWALEAQQKITHSINTGDHLPLIEYQKQGTAMNWAIPSPEHYLPLLYVLSLQTSNEPILWFNDAPVGGALTMHSIKIG